MDVTPSREDCRRTCCLAELVDAPDADLCLVGNEFSRDGCRGVGCGLGLGGTILDEAADGVRVGGKGSVMIAIVCGDGGNDDGIETEVVEIGAGRLGEARA